MTIINGLVGITSELQLWRFSSIANIINEFSGKIEKRTFEIIGTRTRIKKKETLDRQFSIMRRLKLIEGEGDVQILTGLGKALAKLSTATTKQLSLEEKIFFFTLLFTSVTKVQLIILLQIIESMDGSSKNQIIINYFKTDLAKTLWKTSLKNVKKLEEENKMTSFLTNKFSCLSGWLVELDLIKINNENIFSLTNSKIVNSLSSDNVLKQIYQLASTVYRLSARKFNDDLDWSIFEKYFMEAYKIFVVGSNKSSDINAIRKFVSITLLTKERIILEDEQFDLKIDTLISKKKIRSIMLGRDGKPAYVVS